MKKLFILTAILVMIITSSAFAGWGDKTETIKFMSKDLGFYQDVFDGIDSGRDIEIYGKLTIPKNATEGPIPCIVWMHGSSGGFTESANKRINPWLNMFNKMGIATFKLDSFKGRGVRSIVGNQSAVTTAEMIVDVYKALEVLSADSRIDATKIGLMGGSKGGGVAYISMWEPLHEAIGIKEKFAFHISLYGMPCDFEDFRFLKVPLLILVGEKDDYTPAEPWSAIATKMTSNNYDVELVIYKDAYHSFDAHYQPTKYMKAHSYKDCRFTVNKEGVVIETTTGLPETEGMKKCRSETSGVMVGENKNAKKASKIKAAEFVTRVFKLEKIEKKVAKKADNKSDSTDR